MAEPGSHLDGQGGKTQTPKTQEQRWRRNVYSADLTKQTGSKKTAAVPKEMDSEAVRVFKSGELGGLSWTGKRVRLWVGMP